MTRYKFYRGEAGIYGFLIEGHSGFGAEGTDIVCASVSSAAYMAANTITNICNIPAEINITDAKFEVTLSLEDAKQCQDILAGLQLHLDQLQRQYPDFIQPLH